MDITDSGKWATAFAEYSEARHTNGDAIADMALENFEEVNYHYYWPVFSMIDFLTHRCATESETELFFSRSVWRIVLKIAWGGNFGLDTLWSVTVVLVTLHIAMLLFSVKYR